MFGFGDNDKKDQPVDGAVPAADDAATPAAPAADGDATAPAADGDATAPVVDGDATAPVVDEPTVVDKTPVVEEVKEEVVAAPAEETSEVETPTEEAAPEAPAGETPVL